MVRKLVSVLVLVSLVLVLMPAAALAQGGDQPQGQEYTIQKDDWLSKLADKYLGNVFAYDAIVQATNEMAAKDSRFHVIENPDLIEPGWVIWIPAPTTAPEKGYLATIEERGKLIVGTSADYPPFESVDENGNFVGFDMDLIREIGKKMGLEVEIKDMAFDVLIAAVQEGKIDAAIAAIQYTPERDEAVDFSVPYNYIYDAFLVAADSDIVIEKAADIAPYMVGVQSGTTHEAWVLKNLVEPGLMSEDQLFRYERADQAALDLEAGRIDVLFINADPARELEKSMNTVKIALVTRETVQGGQSIAIPEGELGFKAALDAAITELQQEGVLKSLLEKWGIPVPPEFEQQQ
ncbi:MAG: amino acid ABC transporter substrate-binding protein [Chloroflexi bacterium]|nr:MAG: amino acid ABC transporter substrate-binding protein [Chloroflexota bacterium]